MRRVGEPLLDWTPVDRDGYERALRLLAAESVRLADLRRAAVLAGDEAEGRRLYRRLLQIGEQFDELADGIELSRRKRRYVQLDARHVAQGGLPGTVDPTEHLSDILDGMAVVPPKPGDFHPDPRVRRARPRVDPASDIVTLGNGAVWRGLSGWSEEAARLLAARAGMWRLDRHLEALPAAVVAAEADEGVLRRADEILARGWKGRTDRAVVARVERLRRLVANRLDGLDRSPPPPRTARGGTSRRARRGR